MKLKIKGPEAMLFLQIKIYLGGRLRSKGIIMTCLKREKGAEKNAYTFIRNFYSRPELGI